VLMPKEDKKKYVAVVGINFDGLKGKPRIEPGDPIPSEVPQKEIDELVASGIVEEVR